MGGSGGRGQLTFFDIRRAYLELIDEAVRSGARKGQACETLGLSLRTVQRWERNGLGDKRSFRDWTPANKLSEEQMETLNEVLMSEEYRDQPPAQVVASLADQGTYLASEATMYRHLQKQKLLAHRQNSRLPREKTEPKTHSATGPNQVWTWDITYLPTKVKGRFLFLYIILDLYSRKVVGYDVLTEQSSEAAGDLAWLTHLLEAPGENIVLHSDNGSPMKGATMLATLQALGITPSFSRPSVSNDNAFSEALFRTLKYRPCYPERPFEDIEEARAWVEDFVQWYNHEHRHSGIKYVTPHQRHTGQDRKILEKRDAVYKAAREKNPERWSGKTRNWEHDELVTLNPVKEGTTRFLAVEQIAC